MLEIGLSLSYSAEKLCNEWVAFSTRKSCELDLDSLDQLEAHLQKAARKTPGSRRNVTKSRTHSSQVGGMVMSEDDLDQL